MKTLPIIIAPDPRLKIKAKEIKVIDQEIKTIIKDMINTMYMADGIGLAATQVGIDKRLVVVDTSDERRKKPNPIVLINPKISNFSKETWIYNEGCLSLPEQYADVERPKEITVEFLDENGKEQTLNASELLATCIQHEIDHLDGVLFIDHISLAKKDSMIRKLKKLKKEKGME